MSEHQLNDQSPGTVLNTSVTVVSTNVADNLRSIVLTRPMAGAGPEYYTFGESEIKFLNAYGSGPVFDYHKAKMPSSLTLLPEGKEVIGSCLCKQPPKPFGQATGSLVYNPTKQPEDVGVGTVGFYANKCQDLPFTSLIAQKNPTCDVRYYSGGLMSCHHLWSLLDADQDIPWADQPLVMMHKWRIYVQPYVDGYHKNVNLKINPNNPKL